jgi:hypothetical protein
MDFDQSQSLDQPHLGHSILLVAILICWSISANTRMDLRDVPLVFTAMHNDYSVVELMS